MIPSAPSTRRWQEPTEIADAMSTLQRYAPAGEPPQTATEMVTVLRAAAQRPGSSAQSGSGQDWRQWATDPHRLACLGEALHRDDRQH